MTSNPDKTAQILEDAKMLQAGKDPTKAGPRAELPPAAPDAPTPQESATPASVELQTIAELLFVKLPESLAVKWGGPAYAMPAELKPETIKAGVAVIQQYLPELGKLGPAGALLGCYVTWGTLVYANSWMIAPSPPSLDGADPAKAA